MKFYFAEDVKQALTLFLETQTLTYEEIQKIHALQDRLSHNSLITEKYADDITLFDTLNNKYANIYPYIAKCIYIQAKLCASLVKQLNQCTAFIAKPRPRFAHLPNRLLNANDDIQHFSSLLSRTMMSALEFKRMEYNILDLGEIFPNISSLQNANQLIEEIQQCFVNIHVSQTANIKDTKDLQALFDILEDHKILFPIWEDLPRRAQALHHAVQKDGNVIAFFKKINLVFTTAINSYEAFKIIAQSSDLVSHLTMEQMARLVDRHTQEIYNEAVKSPALSAIAYMNLIIDRLLTKSSFKFNDIYQCAIAQGIISTNLKLRLCHADREIARAVQRPASQPSEVVINDNTIITPTPFNSPQL